MRKTALRGFAAVGLMAAVAACGVGGGSKSTTTSAGGGSTTSTGGGSGYGSGSTTTSGGKAAGIKTGAVAYVGAFKYTVSSGTLTPAEGQQDKQKLVVKLDYQNVSKNTVSVQLPDYAVKLDGDEGQASESVKAEPSGDVAGGTKGTVTVTFAVGMSFDPSKVAVVLGDPNSAEAPLVPLGPSARKDSKAPKDEPAVVAVSSLKGGAVMSFTKATIEYAFPEGNKQADKGTAYLVMQASISGATEDISVPDYDTKIKQPDGSVVEATTFIENDKTESAVALSSGQTKSFAVVWVVKNNQKVAGSYELQFPNKDGSAKSTGVFSLT